MVRVFVRRARQITDLKDGKLAQAGVEAALVTDELAKRGKAAQRVRAVRERAIEIDVARQQIAMFRGEVRSVEIRQTRRSSAPLR